MPDQSVPVIDRQAVVIIHGIGEQRPMDTLRAFVESIVSGANNSTQTPFFSKPDAFSDSFELRRLTVNEQRTSFKTDYYEFYWANLMENTRLADVRSWIQNLFVRKPGSIPKRLRWIYYAFWIALVVGLVILALIIKELITTWETLSAIGWVKLTAGAVISGLLARFNGLLVNYLGDAVRYMTPRPHNINERQKIRQAGIHLLRRLHETDKQGKNRYDRIVVVGHSLGSVIAYDLLNLFWCERNTKIPELSATSIDTAEQAALKLETDSSGLDQYRQAQFSFWASQAAKPGSWRVSDLITVGSPLAFAELYLADNEKRFGEKKQQREYSTCPPTMERNKADEAFFSFPLQHTNQPRTLHHAAVFAMTRWTNLYFTNDFVGGPIEGFGPGVENNRLAPKSKAWLPFVSHTKYWNADEPESLPLLRKRMQLRFSKADVPKTSTQTPVKP